MNNGQYPKITIVTPVYNNVKYIKNCIVSVLTQNYPNLEYIVIDGASTDGTAEIIEKYKDKLAYCVSEKDRGQTHALNKGFEKATGDILAWLNADEEYLPGTLIKVGKAFQGQPDLDILFGNRIKIDESRHVVATTLVPSMHPKKFMIYTYGLLLSDATFWSRRLHNMTGELDDINFPHLAMDFDWFIRLSINVRHWKHMNDFFSVFIEREDRKTRKASTTECSGRKARNRVIKEIKIAKTKLIFGWLYYGIQRRWKCQGLKGLIWRPRLSTFLRIIGTKD